MNNKLKKHMVTSDYHIPDHSKIALKLLKNFISLYKPDTFYIDGDFIDFNKASKFDKDPYYHTNINDEIAEATDILADIVKVVKEGNDGCNVIWLSGNHEDRLLKYISRNADQLAELEVDDEYVVSIPHLFQLKKLGVEFRASQDYLKVADTVILHGTTVRQKAGFTANAMLDRFGMSGFSGHTHRLASTARTQYGKTYRWNEIGCLCNLTPTPCYIANADWQNGFYIFYEDTDKKLTYPYQIEIKGNQIVFDGNLVE